jgi:hypothetical protein
MKSAVLIGTVEGEALSDSPSDRVEIPRLNDLCFLNLVHGFQYTSNCVRLWGAKTEYRCGKIYCLN